MSLTINLNFTPAPPPAGQTFVSLVVRLTDAGGTLRMQEFTQAQIQAQAVEQPDGSYNLPVTYATVAVGPYTVTAQAKSVSGGYGPTASGSGTVSLADGAWIPAPVAFV
jgi:hypothetical protein